MVFIPTIYGTHLCSLLRRGEVDKKLLNIFCSWWTTKTVFKQLNQNLNFKNTVADLIRKNHYFPTLGARFHTNVVTRLFQSY